jgi:hypothetical protein
MVTHAPSNSGKANVIKGLTPGASYKDEAARKEVMKTILANTPKSDKQPAPVKPDLETEDDDDIPF